MNSQELGESYELIMSALCLWREARGEEYRGKVAIWWVLKNRLASGRWGRTLPRIVTAPWQFSSFNRDDPNSVKFPMPEDVTWQECLDVVCSEEPDPTNGAQFYFASSIAARPSWARKMTLAGIIGRHEFYRE